MRVGISPVSWTNDDLPELGGEIPFEQCVDEMAAAGYAGTEIGNKYPKDGLVLQAALAQRGLNICNAWFSTWFTSRPEQETIDAFIRHRDFLFFQGAKVIGCSEQGNSIQCRPLPILACKPVFSDRDWRLVIGGMNRLAELAAEKNMKVCVHHHMGTGVQTPEEIDYFLASTRPDVSLLYDSGHIVFSEGEDGAALELLKKQISRVVHVHLKDIRPEIYRLVKTNGYSFLDAVKAGIFTVPGDGMIDFRPIIKLLKENSYQGWLLVEAEQDPRKANPLANARKARDYIQSILQEEVL